MSEWTPCKNIKQAKQKSNREANTWKYHLFTSITVFADMSPFVCDYTHCLFVCFLFLFFCLVCVCVCVCVCVLQVIKGEERKEKRREKGGGGGMTQ